MQNALTLTDWLVLGAVMLFPILALEVERYFAIFLARRQQNPSRCAASKP